MNKFNNGLNLDVPVYHQSNETYSYALNASIINNDVNENIIQNNKGNIYKGLIPEGYILIGERDYNGISYLICYNPETNKGQVGSYPSPSYTNQTINNNGNLESNLELNYKPLRNYRDDFITPDYNNVSDFDTELFNFKLTNPLKVEIQPDYDGSVNIIFTDELNPIRIVNSYFGVLPNNRYELINRQGVKKDNIYNRNNFDNTLNLILKSKKILDLQFNGLGSGQLKAGNYVYYFRYLTASGNFTDIIEESSMVSIFFGTTLSSTRSGLENEPTTKSSRFTLNNVDESFSYVQVSFSYTSNNVTKYYQVENVYAINSSSLVFEHTGFENVVEITIDDLTSKFSNFVTAKSITQSHNRLFVANTKSSFFNEDILMDFARQITIDEDVLEVDIVTGKVKNDIFQKTVDYTNNQFINQNIDNWNLGYVNPMNIYYNLGYWRGEAYSFGIVFILNDGSTTDVFPIRGLDNINNNGVYQNLNLDNTNDFDLQYGENIRGVYRFNSRNIDNIFANERMFVKYVKFNLPTIPQNIKDVTLGCYFVRSEKIPNIVTQGYIANTFKLKKNSTGSYRYTDDWVEVDSAYKVIPLFGGVIEASEWNWISNQRKTNVSAKIARETQNLTTVDYLRYGFYCPDYYLNNSFYSQELNFKQYTTSNFAKVTFNSMFNFQEGSLTFFEYSGSLYYTDSFTLNPNVYNLSAFAYNTPRTTDTFNSGLFTSNFDTDLKLSFFNADPNDNYLKCSLVNDDYVGLLFENDFGQSVNPELLNFATNDRVVVSVKLNVPNINGYNDSEGSPDVSAIPMAFVINLLNSNGYRTTNDLKTTYLIDNLKYTPTTKRRYWSDIENEISNLGYVYSFRGDCFIGNFIKNQFTNKNDDTDAVFQVKIGKSFGIIVESNYNVSLRNPELADINEGIERIALPYIREVDTNNYDNSYNFFRGNLYRTKDSQLTLYGLSKRFTDDVLFAKSSLIPYYYSNFDTRIYVSDLHINNGLVNGYRIFRGINYKDYIKKHGKIVEVIVSNNVFYMIQENAISYLPIAERIITSETAANAVLVQNADVLPTQDNALVISDVYGSRWQFSVKTSNNTVYGVDVEKNKIWRLIGNKLELISDFVVQGFIKKFTDSYNLLKNELLNVDVRTHYNRYTNDIIFVFYNKNIESDTFSLTFNESINKWITFNSWIPYMTFSYFDKFFSLNQKENHNLFYEHNVLPYTTYYDKQENFILEYVINENLNVQKVLDNLQIISNKEFPIKIEYNTDNDTNVIQILVPRQNGNLLLSDIEYRENHFYVKVVKNQQKRIRDKYIKVRIYWNTQNSVYISYILNSLRTSFS